MNDESRGRWWQTDDKSAQAERLVATCKSIRGGPAELDRRDRYLDYARLVSNEEISELGDYQEEYGEGVYSKTPTTHNVCKTVTDAVTARVGQKVPRVQVLTMGGDRQKRLAAEKLTTFIDGLFYETKAKQTCIRMHGDAQTFDIGAVKVFADGPSVAIRRVFPWDIFFDHWDARRGHPTVMYEQDEVDVHWAIEHFGLSGEKAGRLKSEASHGRVCLIEGWKLPLVKGMKNGYHCICSIGGVEVMSDVWMRDYFPILWHVWDNRTRGVHGRGLVEQLIPYQLDLNRTNETIRRSMRFAVPRLVSEANSLTTALSSRVWEHIEYQSGMNAPKIEQGRALSPEVYNEREAIWRNAYEMAGLSMQSAIGRKPAGLNSGEAQRTHHDIETERFAPHSDAWEEFWPRLAHVCVDTAREIYEESREMRVRAPATKLVESIDWGEIDLTEDSYVIRPWPVNPLGGTPAARLERAAEMRRAGDITRLQYLELTDLPDDKATVSLELAPMREIQTIIGNIVDKGVYEPPDDHMDLPLAVKLGHEQIALSRTEKIKSNRLRLLRKFVDDAADLLAELNAQPTNAQAAAAQAPTPAELPAEPAAAPDLGAGQIPS